MGIFLKRFKIQSVCLEILQKLCQVLGVPWVFLTSVLLGMPAGNTVHRRTNSEGEEEIVMFSILTHSKPHLGPPTQECVVHNSTRQTTAYLGIEYPELFINNLRNLLRDDPQAASPSLLILLPQMLLARSVFLELNVSVRHASEILYEYEGNCTPAADRDFATQSSRTHEFFGDLYRSMSKIRLYTEYLKFLLTAHKLLSSVQRVYSAATLTQDSDMDPTIISETDFSSTQATVYINRLLSETAVLSSSFNDISSRTKILINQIFHYAAQKDRQLNVRMAEQSAQIAGDTRTDSYAMRTISILTMLFLPGTFVSAIFGMNFFGQAEGDGKGLSSGKNLWIYFALTVPLTAMVFGCWFWWLRRGMEKVRTPVGSRTGTMNLN